PGHSGPMANDDERSAGVFFHRGKHPHLGLFVESARRFVQQQNLRPAGERARQAYAVPLGLVGYRIHSEAMSSDRSQMALSLLAVTE
ncbi:hypothetical protein AB9F45_36890, partial [Rhizobium leguminosarum]|uniref:hypothetical protein n=1 Tax=Rhizobium leguminosarum TaxID=384 RepID=UPI003F9C2692